ncbi:MAG: hypothetical protein RL701_6672 [Pseudomonadota bacterium]|jgi:hypothetical protein
MNSFHVAKHRANSLSHRPASPPSKAAQSIVTGSPEVVTAHYETSPAA